MSNITYNTEQQVFCLNAISNVSTAFYAQSEQDIQDHTDELVKALVANQAMARLIGAWEVVWGPVVYSIPVAGHSIDYQPMNTMYIAKNPDNQYVVAIAGTSARSMADWFVEDFNIFEAVPWPYSDQELEDVKISTATYTGLANLINMTSGSLHALEFLQQHNATDITVTGHSLGGALSPCFALYLYNKLQADRTNIKISCSPLAGATPGNENFANYYNNCLGKNTTRVWNKYDIVPHACNPALLALVPGLYGEHATMSEKDQKILNAVILTAELLGWRNNYTHIKADDPSFNVGFYTQVQDGCKINPKTYFGQMALQHVDSYSYHFDVPDFQNLAKDIVNIYFPNTLKFPFFSSGAVKPS